jgi:predicted Zn-dependent protease
MQDAHAITPRGESRGRRAGPRRWALALPLALAACTLNPVTKAPEISVTSLEEEKEAGDQRAGQIAEQFPILGDEDPLSVYVRTMGARLAASSPRKDIEYRFLILDTDSANAFSLPGGRVYVSRGLLALLSNESELAGVLAHQIAHVAARHASNRSIGSAASGLLSGLGGVAGGIFGFASFSSLGSVGGIVPPHAPEQEEQADQIGEDLAFKAGWDPAGITEFIRTYERSRSDRTVLDTGFLAVHPSGSARLEAARQHAGKLGKPAPSPETLDRAAFLAKLRGLVIGQDARAGIFDAKTPTLFVQPDLNFRIRFPDGWTTINAPAFVGGFDAGVQITLEPGGEGTDLKKAAADHAASEKKKREDAIAKAKAAGKKSPGEDDFKRTKAGMRMLTKKRATYVIEGVADGGQATVLQYFIEVKPNIYLVTCAMATQLKSQFLNECRRTAATVAPMRKKDLESIRQTTLELGAARAGEQLEDFNERVKNAWTVEQTAAANGLSLPYKLSDGQLLKYALAQPYQPPPKAAGAAPPAPEAPEDTEPPEADDAGASDD